MRVAYHWEIDACDRFDDVAERITYDSFADLLADHSPESLAGGANRPALVRTDGNDSAWAYVDDGQLPTLFLGTYDPVPAHFIPELVRLNQSDTF